MANQANWNGDFDALARQYWAGWNEMMRQAVSYTHLDVYKRQISTLRKVRSACSRNAPG